MHNLNTAFSTTWFLAPYCAWLGYGECLEWFGGVARLADCCSHLPQRRLRVVEQVSDGTTW